MKKNLNSTHLFSLNIDEITNITTNFVTGGLYKVKNRELASRVSKILRLKIDERFILFNSKINICVVLKKITSSELSLYVEKIEDNISITPRIVLGIGLVKKTALEQIAYYAAQLGVNTIVPILTEKVERRWGEEKELKRLVAVMAGAREQSKSFNEPETLEPCKLSEFIKNYGNSDLNLYFEAEKKSLKNLFKNSLENCYSSATLVFGPEGGLVESEMELLDENNFTGYKLTPTILRSTEAVLVGAGSLISFLN
jgi:16S rRNA (uracil1498-N3)-methyltransferase